MIKEVEFDTDAAERRQDEFDRVARELAGYGFHVTEALLPDDIRARTTPSRAPASPAFKSRMEFD